MKKFKMYVGMGLVGCEREDEITIEEMGFTDEEWEAMPEIEREDALLEALNDFVDNYIESNIVEIEDGEE